MENIRENGQQFGKAFSMRHPKKKDFLKHRPRRNTNPLPCMIPYKCIFFNLQLGETPATCCHLNQQPQGTACSLGSCNASFRPQFFFSFYIVHLLKFYLQSQRSRNDPKPCSLYVLLGSTTIKYLFAVQYFGSHLPLLACVSVELSILHLMHPNIHTLKS